MRWLTVIMGVALTGCGERWDVQSISFAMSPVLTETTPDGYDRLQLAAASGSVSADVESDAGILHVSGLPSPGLTSEYVVELFVAPSQRAGLPDGEASGGEALGHVHAAAVGDDTLTTVVAGDLEPQSDGSWALEFDGASCAPRDLAMLRGAQILLVSEDDSVAVMEGDVGNSIAATGSEGGGGGHDHGA